MSEQRIMQRLIAAGLTPEGAAGVLGNIWAESGCEAVRVQGDYEASRRMSKQYAADVDSGRINGVMFARDAKGWGYTQLTYHTRKAEFHDFCRIKEVSIGDSEAQIDFLILELRRDNANLWRFLCQTDDMNLAADRVCREFERPAVNNYNIRRRYAAEAMSHYDGSKPVEPTKPPNEFWPPRTIDKTMEGHDVAAWQALLIAHGYVCNVNGVFDNNTEGATKKFQTDEGLTADGIAGPLSWKAITKL